MLAYLAPKHLLPDPGPLRARPGAPIKQQVITERLYGHRRDVIAAGSAWRNNKRASPYCG